MAIYSRALDSSLNIADFFGVQSYNRQFYRRHPYYFRPCGTLIFTGDQGEGKTLSAVKYVLETLAAYPYCILVSNTKLRDRPFNAYYKVDKDGTSHIYDKQSGEEIKEFDIIDGKYKEVTIEYDGLDSLKYVNNGEFGVLYFIDEIHLDLNSLESKNIDPDIMTELSQQRKQRKHIVGCSQKFNRMAKPLREQFDSVVLCANYFGCIQINKLVSHKDAIEENGKLKAKVKRTQFFFHSADLYNAYDTYQKMKRYNKEWKGRKQQDTIYYFKGD